MERVVVHLDMDAFYASCEELRHPEFRGRPLVVGADPREGKGRGVVLAASYAARAFGVRSAMPIREAWTRIPDAAFVPPDLQHYVEMGRRVFDDLGASFALDRASIDEAYLDATGQVDFGGAAEFGRGLRERVRRVTGGLTASVGIAPNKLVAKVASGHRKPEGTTVVPPEEVQEFLDALPAREIPFIGPKTTERLAALGIETVRDLRDQSREDLAAEFGSHGHYMFEAARGRDDAPVVGGPRAGRSMSHERTLDEDTLDRRRILGTLRWMMDALDDDLADGATWYRTVALKVRFSDFSTLTRQASLLRPTRDTEAARRFVPRLLAQALDGRRAVRLIGLRLGALSENPLQRTLSDFRPGTAS